LKGSCKKNLLKGYAIWALFNQAKKEKPTKETKERREI
jgi:hypothetical protein